MPEKPFTSPPDSTAGRSGHGGKLRLPGMLIFLVFLLSFGCETPKEKGGGGAGAPRPADLSGRKIRVVTTIGMITDIVLRVGGERVQVAGLMGPGVDPHLYKAS